MHSKEMEQSRPPSASSNPLSHVPGDAGRGPAPPPGRTHLRKQFVLCFDGTGNKFSGSDSDSNILKIYRMLDRNGDDQFHYYQPGIGTYVTSTSGSMTRTSRYERFKSWYAKAKDSAVGTSFDLHVMGGYRFLMRYYTPGDDIYFFGFSRGAYTARFLAEMLDHVGLLSAGNEEMCHFAWKTFQKWQCRTPEEKDREANPHEKTEKRKLLEFMYAFRETFSRPVRPIRFLGLFDTVNSVPAFENAWMQRTKFPYTARSSARVIRHAVSIDERRAKFRQDLISQEKPDKSMYYKRRHRHRAHVKDALHVNMEGHEVNEKTNGPYPSSRDTLAPPATFRNPHESSGVRSRSPGGPHLNVTGGHSGATSVLSVDLMPSYDDDEDEGEQDIQEVWFPGCHADIGGGWPLDDGHDAALSHVPLVWMVREAQKAGLEFDEIKLDALHCCYEEPDANEAQSLGIPTIEVNPASPALGADVVSLEAPVYGRNGATGEPLPKGYVDEDNCPIHHEVCPDTKFHRNLHFAATKGRMHDVLQRNNGVGILSVASWNMMEYMPFRRMDLREDGSWEAIIWPLPKGETRDIPANAVIHNSVIRRMLVDPTYRPGNLIVGGGGRGIRMAPKEDGIGKWITVREHGHPVGECFVRKEPPKRHGTDDSMLHTAAMASRP